MVGSIVGTDQTGVRVAYVIRLRRDELEHHMAVAGMGRQKDLAAAMHMSEPAISRALNYGKLGTRLIAGLLATFPDLEFSDLFEIVEESSNAAGPNSEAA